MRALLLVTVALAQSAAAQSYPSQQIRMVVGYAAGGGADRLIQRDRPGVSEVMGQPIVVINRAGSGTVIGTELVATSKPDGYTFLVADPCLLSSIRR